MAMTGGLLWNVPDAFGNRGWSKLGAGAVSVTRGEAFSAAAAW